MMCIWCSCVIELDWLRHYLWILSFIFPWWSFFALASIPPPIAAHLSDPSNGGNGSPPPTAPPPPLWESWWHQRHHIVHADRIAKDAVSSSADFVTANARCPQLPRLRLNPQVVPRYLGAPDCCSSVTGHYPNLLLMCSALSFVQPKPSHLTTLVGALSEPGRKNL